MADSAAKRRAKRANAVKKKAFLDSLKTGASVSAAMRQAGVSNKVYEWANEDEQFARDWDAAIEEGTDRLEDVALRRAVIGTPRSVYHAGRVVGTEHEISDTLLIFLLKARRPEKYRDRYDLSNKDGSLRAFAEAMSRLERDASIPAVTTIPQPVARSH